MSGVSGMLVRRISTLNRIPRNIPRRNMSMSPEEQQQFSSYSRMFLAPACAGMATLLGVYVYHFFIKNP